MVSARLPRTPMPVWLPLLPTRTGLPGEQGPWGGRGHGRRRKAQCGGARSPKPAYGPTEAVDLAWERKLFFLQDSQPTATPMPVGQKLSNV